MKVEGSTIKGKGHTFEFVGKLTDEGDGVYVAYKAKGLTYGPQGIVYKDGPGWEFTEGPRWAIAVGKLRPRNGKDGVWYVHFDGGIAVDGGFDIDQDIITVTP